MQNLILIYLFAFQLVQPPQFKRYDTSSGLSNNIIHDVFQDSEGFLWVATENGLNRFDGHTFDVFTSSSSDGTTISHNVVLDVFEDNDQNLWIGTWNGLNKFDRVTETFTHYDSIPSFGSYRIGYNDIVVDSEGYFWFPITFGVCRFNPRENNFQVIREDAEGSTRFMDTGEFKIFEDSEDSIWIYNKTMNYLAQFDDNLNKLVPVKLQRDMSILTSFNTGSVWTHSKIDLDLSPFPVTKQLGGLSADLEIEKILEDREGNLWVGTNNGVFLQSNNSLEIFNISGSQFGSGSLSYFIEQIYEDRWGGIWIGTRNGLFHYDPLKKSFKNIDLKNTPSNTSQVSNLVMAIEPDTSGVWLGTLGSGLHWYDMEENTSFQYNVSPNNKMDANQIWDIFSDPFQQHILWLATTNGLYRYQTETQQSKHIPLPYSPQENPIIFTITSGKENSIWVAGDHHVYEVDIVSQKLLRRIEFLSGMSVSTVQDLLIKDDRLFISTQGGGLISYNLEQKKFEPPLMSQNALSTLMEFPIWDIHFDSKNNFWLATGSGLFKGDPNLDSLTHIEPEQLHKNYVFFSIAEDDKGLLWLGADDGLFKFEPENGTFTRYDHTHGLANSEFNRRAFATTPDGQFWFGGTNGVTRFYPPEISANPFTPEPHITSFTLFDSDGSNPVPFKNENTLNFKWTENTFEIGFTGITFTNPERVQYKYILENHDPVWIEAQENSSARYSKIPPGDYIFKVLTANSDGIWNTSILEYPIIIHPPIWKTWWAYFSYFVFSILGILLFIRWRTSNLEKERTRLELKVSERTRELEEQKELAYEAKRKIEVQAEQLKELDELKSRFFANISHELRTPLTLIDAPLQQVLGENLNNYPIEKLEKKLQGIQRNSHRLSKLINELLDLSRLKESSIEVTPKQINLRTWFTLLVDSYQSLALAKEISFRTRQEIGDIKYVALDVEKLDKITSNLINNALKYTEPGDFIEIALSISDTNLDFIVADSGIGIEAEELPKIFDRFYKGASRNGNFTDGLGLGLSLSKELAEVLGGTLTAKSTFEKGSSFHLHLPITIDNTEAEPKNEPHTAKKKTGTGVRTALVVEDNSEMRAFIVQLLEKNFEIYEAEHGFQALQLLKAISPNLIVSDLMMPEMDGLELTQKLRSIPNFAHIPILMLTARATDEDRLHSLRIGVDDYLNKPFIPEEVRVRAINLAENHKKRIFLNSKADASEHTPQEKELLGIQQIIEEQLSNTSLNVLSLAASLHTSERQLYRTVQRLTGMTPNEYINSIRLNYARKLLTSDKITTIDIVAGQAGFKSRSYFSRLFKKAYGLSPGKFQARK